MAEWRLFDPAEPPAWTTPEWYAERETAPHLEQEGHRQRLLLTADMVYEALSQIVGPGDAEAGVVDLGSGDGGLISLFNQDTIGAIGYDLQQTNVDAAKERGVVVLLRDVVADFPAEDIDPLDVLVASEMLEHLLDPHAFVRQMAASDARWAVVSSPYTETDLGHYGFHCWAWDLDGYRALMEEAGWRVIRQETAWISQVLLCQKAS